MRQLGFTMVEMAVAMSIGSIGMVGVVVIFELVLRTDAMAQRQSRTTVAIGRLASQFRGDVHRARGMRADKDQADPKKQLLRITMPDETVVEYRADAPGVLRTETSAGKRKQEELFSLPSDSTFHLETETHDQAPVARIRIGSAEQSGPHVVIEAVADKTADRDTRKKP